MSSFSPRWMTWTQRSFIFNTVHASSKLYLAVYDLDSYVSCITSKEFEFIGRVVINLTNFHFQKEYLLHYKLRNASLENAGTITVRLRMECPNERSFIVSSLRLPKPIYLNVKSRTEYLFAKTAIFGKQNDEFSISRITEHINELLLHPKIIIFIIRALFCIILWRGHFRISIYIPRISNYYKISVKSTDIYLPLHSIAAFIAGITLVEYPYLIIAYSSLTITWLMIATMEFRNKRTPSLWYHCRTFRDFLTVLIRGQSSKSPSIEPNQNTNECNEFTEQMQKKLNQVEEEFQFFLNMYKELVEEEYEEIQDLDLDKGIVMKERQAITSYMNPLKPTLYPVQLLLREKCTLFRRIENIVTWRESHISFWVTFCSFTFSLCSFFIPKILLWTARILSWLLLGPWMKLVDLYLIREYGTSLDFKGFMKGFFLSQKKAMATRLKRKRIIKENNEKLINMRKSLFGEYTILVPTFDTSDREHDLPLPSSSARDYHSKSLAFNTSKKVRIPGQALKRDPAEIINQYLEYA